MTSTLFSFVWLLKNWKVLDNLYLLSNLLNRLRFLSSTLPRLLKPHAVDVSADLSDGGLKWPFSLNKATFASFWAIVTKSEKFINQLGQLDPIPNKSRYNLICSNIHKKLVFWLYHGTWLSKTDQCMFSDLPWTIGSDLPLSRKQTLDLAPFWKALRSIETELLI